MFAPLPAVRADVHLLSQVLEMPSIGRFEDCLRVEDSSKAAITQSVESFLNDREPDELVVLYLSGHGEYEREDGQLYYIASDTRSGDVEKTGVKASFITEQLESCAAQRKILLLDCCFSGAAVQGFRSKGGAQAQPVPRVEASGVYVITASHHWERSFTSTPGEPSQFTGAMVKGLHTGRADLDGDGRVSADDLFRHISRELKNAPADKQQTPTKSSLSVTGDIFLAKSAVGRPVPSLKPLPASAVTADPAGGPATLVPVKSAPVVHDDKAFTEADWSKLFDYYLQCLREESSGDALLSVNGRTPPRAVWPAGQESLLSGTSASVPVSAEIVSLAEKAGKDGADLWYGYPAVVLFDGKQQVCAPLVMQQIEVVTDAQGHSVAVPAGPAIPHPKLVLDRLGKDEGLELLASYQPSWRPGFRDEMVRDLRSLLDQLALTDTEHLDPGALGDGSTLRAAHEGARNVALVYAAKSDSAMTAKLVKDYKTLQKSVGLIADTALGALASPAEPEAVARSGAVRVVAPLELNEAQEAVIRSAMSSRLTVATGPPGTGKSQLIVNAVATARAAGESVLVASTNNKAVDEVWDRCEKLTPGLIIRTGSKGGERDNVETELLALEELTRVARPARSADACRGDVRNAVRDQESVRQRMAEVAERERLLAELGRRRSEYADAGACDPNAVGSAFGDDHALSRWLVTARRASRAWLFGRRRRSRAVRRLSALPVRIRSREDFAALVSFAQDESAWRAESAAADQGPGDAALLADLGATDREARRTAEVLLRALVQEQAAPARQALFDRIEAVRAGSSREWAALDKLLPNVSGWAVTARSARRFRDRPGLFDLVIIDEASQCSTLDILPLLFRAKRALVIGDPMQLPHITTIQPRQEAASRSAATLRGSWLEEHRLGYRRYSSFHATARAAGSTLLLDEHFRCHPDIVSISNRYCYADRLTILTDPRSLRRLDGVNAVQWLDIEGKARQGRNGSWINEEEAERVHIAVERLLARLPDGASVGVVTPFRAQKELIAPRWAHEPRVRVGTVHTFQGGQQDVMLLSLVAGPAMRPSAINWLCREVNLWNVAITRARSHLIVLGDRDFWSARTGMPRALLDAAAGHEPRAARDAEPNERSLAVADQFQKLLSDAAPGAVVDRNTVIDGYPCDFEVRSDSGVVPVLLDLSAPAEVKPARHLRLALARSVLLPGGVRVPLWHAWAERLDRALGDQRPM
ncbi:AAA family ATPase [Streptomyces sp. ISL-96]|uniref:caspase, EACC1-associated type n=1 Tax=Streptomyces sp. ISL-96 TaxID=2819191 RepID=UPI001BEC7110|nr:AAA domain-containing protein [Streptomyces sp. ISL-96]MBT2488671.1 AAA family ATPase [Streptomyces sp. ISL-96]